MRWESTSTAASRSALQRTVLFSDVVQSTAVIDERGDAAWFGIVDHHTRAVVAAAAAHDGVVNNFMGDGFMIVFERPSDAVACALDLQSDSVGGLALRIGIDHGDVYPFRDAWYVGLTIHIASRLTDLCPDGGIAVSDRVASAAGHALRSRSVDVRLVAVRGLTEPCVVHVLDPAEFAAIAIGHPSATPTVSSAP